MEVDDRAGFIQLHRHERTLLNAPRFYFLPLEWKQLFAFGSDELDLILHQTDIGEFAGHELMGPSWPFG